MFPPGPMPVGASQFNWLALSELEDAIDRVSLHLLEWAPELPHNLQLSKRLYSQVANLPFGETRRDLLAAGAYVITDSSPSQRVLYVGSTVDGSVRSRLRANLFKNGRTFNAQETFSRVLTKLMKQNVASEQAADLLLRRALWSQNRWAHTRNLGRSAREAAARLVGDGAFDISVVRVPKDYEILARCIEHYATEFVRSRTGAYPPLNDAPVILDRGVNLGSALDIYEVQAIFEKLAILAKQHDGCST